uniref:redoxin domain-containing protein n=1 Tax=Dokdonella sp. TaxID=2291710 RepID=UPI00262AF070
MRIARPGAVAVGALVLWAAGLLGAAGAAADELEPGRPAPPFSAVDSKGTTRHLADYRGKIVVLEWTNADCPYTKKHY